MLVVLLVVIFGAAAFGFMQFQKMREQNNIANNPSQSQEQQVDLNQNMNANASSDTVAEDFFKEAGADTQNMVSVDFNSGGETNVSTGEENSPVATVSDAPSNNSSGDLFGDNASQPFSKKEQNSTENQNSGQIVISYNNISRLNPFKPFEIALEKQKLEMEQETQALAEIPFEVIEPPTSSVPDENITSLLDTQISGILYDDVSPSAIVNINGQDQFVKVGDVVSGYKIDGITRNKVQISYMNNSYVASVGELFTRGALESQPAVDNLENKFAGRYKNKDNNN